MAKENASEAHAWKAIDYYKPKTRDINLVEWPGSGGKQVGILKLSCAELQQARFAAIDYFTKKNIELTIFSSAVLDAEEMVQQCHLFLIDPDSRNQNYRIFRGADEARNKLTDDERYYFCKKYNELYNIVEK